MKTDSDIKRDVMAELAWEPMVNSNKIGVAVSDGVVTVSGHLDTYAQKWAVENAVQRVKGVKAVALELDVRLANDHVRSDTDIAMAAENALKWHALVPVDAVRVTVNHGNVAIDGEVDWDYQRESVVQALRNLKGVPVPDLPGDHRAHGSSSGSTDTNPRRADPAGHTRGTSSRHPSRQWRHGDTQGEGRLLAGPPGRSMAPCGTPQE